MDNLFWQRQYQNNKIVNYHSQYKLTNNNLILPNQKVKVLNMVGKYKYYLYSGSESSPSSSSPSIPEGAQSSLTITSTIPEQLTTTLPTETTENELLQTSSSPFSSSTTSSPSSTNSPTHIPSVDKSVDLDGDGALSLNEVQYAAFVHHGLSSSVVENLFNDVDFNKDGFLSSIEFNEIRPLVLAKAENAALRYLQVIFG
ncbi:unnamed protein product [Meloidogyne enterolobii]|uniref:Uncharacterized protein n=1 Tax=Meloidogyne enterolobii TaxID=390850 RepID=A0ACB0ZEX9_MELEN